MGMSDYHIFEIKIVKESNEFCPNCGKKTIFIVGDIGGGEGSVNYCPECETYFTIDEGYFTDDVTKGMEKLREVIKNEWGR